MCDVKQIAETKIDKLTRAMNRLAAALERLPLPPTRAEDAA